MTGGKKETNQQLNIDFISLSEAAKMTGYSLTHMNLLSRSGKLKAMKIGKNWHTTSTWVEDFLEEQNSKKENEKDQRLLMRSEDKDYLETEKAAMRVMEKYELEAGADHEKPEREKENEKAEAVEIEKVNSGMEARAEKKKIMSLKLAFSTVMIMAIALVGVAYKIGQIRNEDRIVEIENFFNEKNISSRIINENEEAGQVMGEEDASGNSQKIGSAQESENFVIDEVSFGAGVILAGSDENKKLEMDNVRSESFLDTKKNEVKMLVSWNTNKPAKTEINYSKNNGTDIRKIEEDSFGYTHAAVISGLEPKTSYVYKIKGSDKWGNTGESDFFGTFTTSKPISVFELITKALDELFGWAFKNQQ
jgi:hypothetical protein